MDVLQRRREDVDLLHLSAERSELAALSEILDRGDADLSRSF
ncbi:hypothetical protein ACFU6I_43720 [Streptomyces sp. NPDC057486]